MSPHISNEQIKEEPLAEENSIDMEKDRQKKDNHNQSKTHLSINSFNNMISKLSVGGDLISTIGSKT